LFKALHDLVWMKPIEEETRNGIILVNRPDGVAKAKVIYVGCGSNDYKAVTDIKVGDTVAIMTGMVQKKTLEGEEYLVCHAKEVLGVFE
jgi:co-chaperonin GroES (HSP10)